MLTMQDQNLTFLTEQTEILKALLESKQSGTAIGIIASKLDEKMIVTGIDDILIEDGRTTVVLKHYDASGYILPSRLVPLSAIDAVCPFVASFNNPILSNIEKTRSWIG